MSVSPKRLELTGQRFGRLTVLSFDRKHGNLTRWLCRCDCGVEKTVLSVHLRRGKIVSCGCWAADKARERATHGMSQSRTYIAWRSMLNRCYWPKEKRFDRYGGRGISVCDQWIHSFETFLADMGEVPAAHSLDRINNDGNYEPTNCRWATRIEQANNKRSNVFYEYKGERVAMKELSRRCGVNYSLLYWRLRVAKWDFDKAVTP